MSTGLSILLFKIVQSTVFSLRDKYIILMFNIYVFTPYLCNIMFNYAIKIQGPKMYAFSTDGFYIIKSTSRVFIIYKQC